MNADGWGVGFFDDGDRHARRGAAPRRCGATPRSRRWRPRCAADACRRGALGECRDADRAVGVGAVHRRQWLLSHNGLVDRAVLPLVRGRIDQRQRAAGRDDLRTRLDALGDTIAEVAAADPNARLNILAANGSQLRATTWVTPCRCCVADDGVVLASEPYDDNPDWQEIPDRHLVVVEATRVDLIPLKGSL
jgi:glutamine amidotransferase